MAWNLMLTNLRDVLADLYFSQRDSVRVVQDAKLPVAYIDFEGSSITRWHSILREADRRHKVDNLIGVARGDYPENEWLISAEQGQLLDVRGPDIQKDIKWEGPEDEETLEKIMGPTSTLLPISFLQTGLERSRSVGKVVLSDGSGSGFLTTDNLLITNNHVLRNESDAHTAKVLFNYQLTPRGLDAKKQEYQFDPDNGFATSTENDWTAVRVKGDPNAKWGALPIKRLSPKAEDRVNIVQHPGGGPKQIALYHNVITSVGSARVQYLTDTLPGSSGSPAFDRNWDVIALHHSGGWLREPNSKKTVYRNEGIHINAVIEGLEQAGLLPNA